MTKDQIGRAPSQTVDTCSVATGVYLHQAHTECVYRNVDSKLLVAESGVAGGAPSKRVSMMTLVGRRVEVGEVSKRRMTSPSKRTGDAAVTADPSANTGE